MMKVNQLVMFVSFNGVNMMGKVSKVTDDGYIITTADGRNHIVAAGNVIKGF